MRCQSLHFFVHRVNSIEEQKMHLQAQDPQRVQTDPTYWEAFIPETEAADYLCQSVRTIQKWRVTGAGPQFFKFGRSVRYRRRDLFNWVEERRKAHTAQ